MENTAIFNYFIRLKRSNMGVTKKSTYYCQKTNIF